MWMNDVVDIGNPAAASIGKGNSASQSTLSNTAQMSRKGAKP